MTHPIVGAASVLAMSLAPVFIADRDQLLRLLEERKSARQVRRAAATVIPFPQSKPDRA